MESRLRFAVGDRVECNLGDRWEPGTVVALNYFGEGMIKPYQAQLDSGEEVFAPRDDDGVIRRLHRPSTDPALRFAVGDRVECNLGDRWEPGTVVALNIYHDGVVEPYLARLLSGGEVFAPRDDDSVIRASKRPHPITKADTKKHPSRLARKRVSGRASPIGTKRSSKLGSTKLARSQRARAHKSARPAPREETLAMWSALSDRIEKEHTVA